MNHTPGPWYAEITNRNIWIGPPKASGTKVDDIVAKLECGTEYSESHNTTTIANGHLIAAAPELYAALEYLLKEAYCDGADPKSCCTCLCYPEGERMDHCANPCEVCKSLAALAKARGEGVGE